MPFPVHIPRINNNDDTVRVATVAAVSGEHVRAGRELFSIESDKAVVTVDAERDGYVLSVLVEQDQMVAVGAVGVWLGERAGEPVPVVETKTTNASSQDQTLPPTVKAREMLNRFGLREEQVPRAGQRLTTKDIEAYAKEHGLSARTTLTVPEISAPSRAAASLPAPADIRPASPARRAMATSVGWQRDSAVAAYLEYSYDPRPWDDYAAKFAGEQRQLFDPLLSLMAHRLSTLAREFPNINATVLEQAATPLDVRYQTVNMGFTVQARDMLYLIVLPDAEHLDEAGFVTRFVDLQRRALARKLRPSELTGATIGFTSMARWGVRRHIPVLAPYTSLMVAHSANRQNGDSRTGILGATYDHRVLSGGDVIRVLKALAEPPVDPQR